MSKQANKKDKLQRRIYKMSADLRRRLKKEGVLDDYNNRPAYQQNDYLWWIDDAKREETKEKRVAQMIKELKKGGVYMGVEHKPSKK